MNKNLSDLTIEQAAGTPENLTAIVIPSEGPMQVIEMAAEGNLGQLTELVGGMVQAIPVPDLVGEAAAEASTAYINEEGKYDPNCKPNMRATDFFVPGKGLFFGDYIAGTLVLAGFDPMTGEHAPLPHAIIRRAKLIEREAGV